MPLTDYEVKNLALDLFKVKSERDKQSKIGASEIGNPCDYCVGFRLLGHKQKDNQYWLAAKLGTGMHAVLEMAGEEADPDDYRFGAMRGAWIETSIVIGELPGYGILKSKPDLVLQAVDHLIDWKSSTKAKVAKYKLDGVPMQYVYQQMLYAWGLRQAGVIISKLSLVFVNRDGGTDSDVWIYSFDYDEGIALKAWSRLELIWSYLNSGDDPEAMLDTLESHTGCYYCTRVIGRI